MLLTLAEQIETLYAAARSAGVPIDKDEIRWRDEFVDVGGLKVHYLDWGTPGKRPLLLLHGGMQNAHSWDMVAVVMKRDFHVVAMDLRGHGDSDWSDDGDYGYATHSADIEKIVAHLGWDKLALIGMSLGGLGAMNFAAHHSNQLDALVIVDVGPELNPAGVGRIVDFSRGPAELDSIEDFIQRAVEYNPRRSADQLRYSLTHNLRRLPNGKWTWKYDRRVARRRSGQESPPAPNSFGDMWESLRQIQCPTLIVRGADSNVFREETGRKMADFISNSHFVTVPDAGHTVPQDNPAGFLEAVRPFLEDLSS
jgi:pimeloyl-ACP methyl ester carboxylesterase